jgi:hypothetical protein
LSRTFQSEATVITMVNEYCSRSFVDLGVDDCPVNLESNRTTTSLFATVSLC